MVSRWGVGEILTLCGDFEDLFFDDDLDLVLRDAREGDGKFQSVVDLPGAEEWALFSGGLSGFDIHFPM